MVGPRKWQRLIIIASVLCAGALILLASSGDQDNNKEAFPRRKLGTPAECETTCKDPPMKDSQHFDNQDLTKPANMLARLKAARSTWVEERLKKDYGADNYQNMFEPMQDGVRLSVGRNNVIKDVMHLPQYKNQPSKPAEGEAAPEEEELENLGWYRFVNKLKMKVLQTQLGILEERENAKPICLDECSREGEQGSRFLKVEPSTGLYTKFTWATGGHSASAGHGNFFRESYTATMGRALAPIFKHIGLEFEARNYAMGGTDCADEISLCMNQIFGRDIDAISWDYGMTDGREIWKMTMYAYKAAGISRIADSYSMPAKIAHRPAFFAIHQSNGHNTVVKNMHELGMTTLAYDNNVMKEYVIPAIPDMVGLSESQIESLPSHLQYYKCDGALESGDPGCKEHKWNATYCNKRKARTSWHPGWKDHALKGNLWAITILDAMEDALQDLIDTDLKAANIPADETPDQTKLRLLKQLQDLDAEEKQRYENIFKQPIPEQLQPHIKAFWKDGKGEHLTDMDMEAFFKQTSFCHTAVLPSEMRFKGLLTEDFDHVGKILDQNYDQGVNSTDLTQTENPRAQSDAVAMVNPKGAGKMMLIRDDNNRQQCEEYVNLDFKDYFHVSGIEGWQSLTLPNDSEKKVYTEFDAAKAKGYIAVCLARCDWGKCRPGDMSSRFGWIEPRLRKGEEPPPPEEIAKLGKVKIVINGEEVTEASNMDECYALRNKNGHVWKPNADGRYEIQIRIAGSSVYSFIHISSFIIV